MSDWREVLQVQFLGNPLGTWAVAVGIFLVTFTILPLLKRLITARRRARGEHSGHAGAGAAGAPGTAHQPGVSDGLRGVARRAGSELPAEGRARAHRGPGAAVLDADGALDHDGGALCGRCAPPALHRSGHAAQELDGGDPLHRGNDHLGRRRTAGARQPRHRGQAAAGGPRHRRHRARAGGAERALGSAGFGVDRARQALRPGRCAQRR